MKISFNKKVLFMDLDGTLIETKSGNVFPTFIGDMQFKDDVLTALYRFIKRAPIEYVFIVTNQGGMSNGTVKEQSFRKKADYICQCISDFINRDYQICDDCGETIEGIKVICEYCKTNLPNDPFRKPNTGMLEYLIQQYVNTPERISHENTVSKSQMLMVGDASGLSGQFSDSDLMTAKNYDIDYMDVSKFVVHFIKL